MKMLRIAFTVESLSQHFGENTIAELVARSLILNALYSFQELGLVSLVTYGFASPVKR